MKTINQRQLRNDSAEVMRSVDRGETFTVTRRGVPIAVLSPIGADLGLRCARPARKRPTYSVADLIVSSVPTEVLLDGLRDNR